MDSVRTGSHRGTWVSADRGVCRVDADADIDDPAENAGQSIADGYGCRTERHAHVCAADSGACHAHRRAASRQADRGAIAVSGQPACGDNACWRGSPARRDQSARCG
jgi:hypothetical protein